MRKIRFIVALSLILIPIMSEAQSLTNKERREINSCVLNVIKEYDRFASLYDDESEYYFRTMFENENAPIFCDIMGSPSYMDNITVSEYIELLKNNSQNTMVEIRNVAKGQLEYDGKEWLIPVYFKKSIAYMDNGGYLFSVENYHGTDVNITMLLSYDAQLNRCLIRSITGDIDSDKDFPKGRFIIVNQADSEMPARDQRFYSSLRINGKTPEYNQFGQAILENGEAQVDDPDVEVISEVVGEGYNYDIMAYKFKTRNTRIRLRYGYSPHAYLVKASEGVDSRSNAMEIGGEIGFAFPSSSYTKISLNTGMGISISNLNLSYQADNSRYRYTTSVFDKNLGLYKDYIVDYNIISASQSVNYVDLYVPVFIEAEHRLNKYLALVWNVGVKGYLQLSAKQKNPYSVEFTNNGKQSTLSETSTESICYINHTDFNKKPLDLSVMANLGLDVNLMKNRIYFMIRGGYEYGIAPIYQSHTDAYFNSDHYPIICNPYTGKDIAVQSLMSGLSFQRGTFWISAGVKFKL